MIRYLFIFVLGVVVISVPMIIMHCWMPTGWPQLNNGFTCFVLGAAVLSIPIIGCIASGIYGCFYTPSQEVYMASSNNVSTDTLPPSTDTLPSIAMQPVEVIFLHDIEVKQHHKTIEIEREF